MCCSLLSASALAADEATDCPEGTIRAQTDNPYEPFTCRRPTESGAELKSLFGPRGFKTRPRCPRGTRPVMTPGKLQPYRCVADASGPGATAYLRCTVPRELSFDYPNDWRLKDAWTDEVPTLFIAIDPGRGGRQVTMVVSRLETSQAGFEGLEEHMLKEKRWQGAADAGGGRVAGLPARFTEVKGESRTVYLPWSADRYYTLTFTAPPDLYGAYEPAFARLLTTFKFEEKRGPE